MGVADGCEDKSRATVQRAILTVRTTASKAHPSSLHFSPSSVGSSSRLSPLVYLASYRPSSRWPPTDKQESPQGA